MSKGGSAGNTGGSARCVPLPVIGVIGAVVLVSLAAAPCASAQATSHASHAALRAIPLAVLQQSPVKRSGIGAAHEPVTTQSADAQRWYDEGLAHLHSFSWIDAARAFHAAARADARLAMAHLGLSLAFGGLGSGQGAADALRRARELESSAGPRDRVRIDLRDRQLRAASTPASAASPASASATTEDVRALDRALSTYPADVELLLLRGEAASGAGSMQSDASAVPFFERAQRASPAAFAPHHYLAHAYENSGQVASALRESQVYAKMAPSVPHAHHMVAHSLRRTGRPVDAIAAFERADRLANATLAADKVPAQYDWHTHHNTVLLAETYRYVGRLRSAADLLRTAFASSAPLLPEELNKREWPALLLARGALPEALKASLQLAAHDHPMVRAAGHLAASHVHMAAGRLKEAGAEADAALRDLRTVGADAVELAPELRMAQGEFLLRGGDREQGQSMTRQAVSSLRARPGADAWGQTLFAIEAATKAARQAGDATLAGEMTEQMRLHDPHYAGTSFQMALSAEARGDRAGAARAYQDALQRWQGADADHPDATHTRRQLAAFSSAKSDPGH